MNGPEHMLNLETAKEHRNSLRQKRTPLNPFGTIAVLDYLIVEVEQLRAKLSRQVVEQHKTNCDIRKSGGVCVECEMTAAEFFDGVAQCVTDAAETFKARTESTGDEQTRSAAEIMDDAGVKNMLDGRTLNLNLNNGHGREDER